MKKSIKIAMISLAIITVTTMVQATIGVNVKIQPNKTQYEKQEEVVVEVALSNIQSERGIITFAGTLQYDRNSLELVKMEGQNGWGSPSYNEANGKFVMDRNSLLKESQTILKITWKVKDTTSKDVSIAIENMSVADGNEEASIAKTMINITVNQGSVTPGENQDPGNTNTVTNTVENTVTGNTVITPSNNTIHSNVVATGNTTQGGTATGRLPQTGDNDVLVFAILAVAIVAIGFYIRKKIVEKQ